MKFQVTDQNVRTVPLPQNFKLPIPPYLNFYGMIKIHKTPGTMRPIISCTGSLMHTLGVSSKSKFRQMEADMIAYFKDSKVLK